MTRAIEDLGFDSVWLGEHLLYRWADRPARGPVGGLDAAGRDRRLDVADRARAARRLHQLPQPGAARQAGRHDRRDQRRPVRPRPRRRLERDRVPRLRLPVRPPDRPVRGGVHDHPDAPARGRHRLRRPLVPGPRLRAPAARPAAGRPAADDRLERAADAPRDDGPRRLVERWYNDIGQPPGRRRRRSATTVDEACREVGRDPAEVERTVAVLVRLPGGDGTARRAISSRAGCRRSSGEPGRARRDPARLRRARASPTSSSSSTRSRPSIEALAPALELLDREA